MSLIGNYYNHNQAENGKTELSLVHFTHTNPEWQPPNDAGTYITNLKERAVRDVNLPTLEEENPLFASLNSISSLGNEVCIKLSCIGRMLQVIHFSYAYAFHVFSSTQMWLQAILPIQMEQYSSQFTCPEFRSPLLPMGIFPETMLPQQLELQVINEIVLSKHLTGVV